MEHLTSLELVGVDPQSIFKAIVIIFDSHSIPWTNLVSALFDRCNVMRGSNGDVETLLRQRALQLIDIDGDSCHHVQIVAKIFCEPFDLWPQQLFQDLYLDFKYRSEHKEIMSELCRMGHVNFTVPLRFISHLWLSAYDQVSPSSRGLSVCFDAV